MHPFEKVSKDKRELFKEVFDMIDITCDTDVSKMIDIVNDYVITDNQYISKFEVTLKYLEVKQIEMLEKVKQNEQFKLECIEQGIKDIASYTLYEHGRDILALNKISIFIVDLQNNIRKMKSYVL